MQRFAVRGYTAGAAIADFVVVVAMDVVHELPNAVQVEERDLERELERELERDLERELERDLGRDVE